MFQAFFLPLARRGWRRAGLLAGGLVIAGSVAWFGRGQFLHRATAQQAPPRPAETIMAQGDPYGSDYANRVVAYIHNNEAISRQDLGEYLIARCGAEKLPLLVNKRILDDICRQHNIVVTAGEIDAALEEELKGLSVDRKTFLDTILKRYKKNLYEFKEDILRPRLQLTQLVRPSITVAEDDLRKAYDSAFGEKVECRMILWAPGDEKRAMDLYATLRDSEAAFAQAAKQQKESSLASSGGRIKPIARYAMDKQVEDEAFKLQPGQVSELIRTPQGIMLLKCDRRIPADTTVNFQAIRERLEAEIRERKLHLAMGQAFKALREQARPQLLLQKNERPAAGAVPVPAPTQPVAILAGNQLITREDLGEFLIARFGGDKLEYLVNYRILQDECRAKNVSVSDQEVEAAFQEDLKAMNMTDKVFQKEVLSQLNKNLYEWREDVIRPRLALTKLAQGRVKVTEEDILKGYETYHGEKLKCRMILWPHDQQKFALNAYGRIRDSDDEFRRTAQSQVSGQLAAKGGVLPPIGRYSLGNEELEREAFRLQKGEITPLIGTPEGYVVLKCDERIPADTSVKLEKVRDKLTQEALAKKTQMEVQVVFKELHKKANPKLLLKGTGQPEDLAAEAKKLLGDLSPSGGSVRR
jgi:parvulin-like peptidyl-prolyl isomerase